MNMFRSFVVVVSFFCVGQLLHAGTYSGGSGTAEDPYQIATYADLVELSGSTDDYWRKHFIQTADIDATSVVSFVSIGTEAFPFNSCTYDGAGFEISDLYISTKNKCAGLFGNTINSDFLNISLKNVSITRTEASTVAYAGAMIGKGEGGELSNCSSSGTVYSKSLGSHPNYSYSGGLVGFYNGCIDSCTSACETVSNSSAVSYSGGLVARSEGNISGCYSNGSSFAESSSDSQSAVSYSGGLVGYHNGDLNESNSAASSSSSSNASEQSRGSRTYSGGLVGYKFGTYKDSFATGDSLSNSVSTSYNSDSCKAHSGGLIGYNGGQVIKCHSTGLTSSSSSSTSVAYSHSHSYSGGLIGSNSSGDIAWCYSTSESNSSSYFSYANYSPNYSSAYSGGLIGNNSSKIENCYSTGSSSAFSDSAFLTYSSYSGGLVGSNRGEIISCYSAGSSLSKSSSILTSSNSSSSYSGGLVGYSSYLVRCCYSFGSSTSESEHSSAYSGGVVGKCAYNLTNCYAVGSSTSTSPQSFSYSGGLVGFFGDDNNQRTIKNCYSAGHVSSSYAPNSGGLVGSIVNGVVEDSYWDTQTTGLDYSAGSLGIGLPTAELKTKDFSVIWDMQAVLDSDHPWIDEGDSSYPTLYLNLPQSTIIDVTNIMETSATVNAQFSNNTPNTISEYGIEYSRSYSDFRDPVRVPADSNSNGLFEVSLDSLSKNYCYYVRSYVKSGEYTILGESQYFYTLSRVVEISNFSEIKSNSANVNCRLLDANTTEYGIEYSLSSGFSNINSLQITTNSNGGYIAPLTGLSSGLEYFVRAYSVVDGIRRYSEANSFRSIGVNIKDITKKFNNKEVIVDAYYGDISPTSYGIEVSTRSDFYNASVIMASNALNGAYSVEVKDLLESTNYYVRATITVDGENFRSETLSFSTTLSDYDFVDSLVKSGITNADTALVADYREAFRLNSGYVDSDEHYQTIIDAVNDGNSIVIHRVELGWNLISSPFEGFKPMDILGNNIIRPVYAWNPDHQYYNTLSNLQPFAVGETYWVYYEDGSFGNGVDSLEYAMTGQFTSNFYENLDAGWNMVGAIYEGTAWPNSMLMYKWADSYYQEVTGSTMELGHGYWLFNIDTPPSFAHTD